MHSAQSFGANLFVTMAFHKNINLVGLSRFGLAVRTGSAVRAGSVRAGSVVLVGSSRFGSCRFGSGGSGSVHGHPAYGEAFTICGGRP